MPKDFRTRKKGTPSQQGQAFPLHSRNITGNPRVDTMKELYLQKLVQETKTHDINDIWTKLDAEGRSAARTYQAALSRLDYDQQEVAKEQVKMDVLSEVIGVLKQIQQTGRTRIGDSELKALVRNIMRSKKLDPRALGIKLS